AGASQTTLEQRGLELVCRRRQAFGPVVASVVDRRADGTKCGVAGAEPAEQLMQARRGLAGLEPCGFGVPVEDHRHPVVERRDRVTRRRGEDRAGAELLIVLAVPDRPEPGERE